MLGFHQSSGDGQSQTIAAPFDGLALLLVEALEDMRQTFRRDARPAVGHMDNHLTPLGQRSQPDGSASGCKAKSVIQQDEQHLTQPDPVAAYGALGCLESES